MNSIRPSSYALMSILFNTYEIADGLSAVRLRRRRHHARSRLLDCHPEHLARLADLGRKQIGALIGYRSMAGFPPRTPRHPP